MPSHAHALKLLLKNRLETRFDDVQATVESLVGSPDSKGGRSKIELQATLVRQNDSVPRRDKSSSKGKSTRRVTRPHTCTYEHCTW